MSQFFKVSHLLRASVALSVLASLATPAAALPFISEFHYDDASTDINEFIEVAGPAGFDLTGWQIVLYNGTSSVRAPYGDPIALSGTFADQSAGFGFQSYFLPVNGIQNGAPDGIALISPTANVSFGGAANNVRQFISYEGSFEALGGDAAGLTSLDIGVAEAGEPEGLSLQLTGSASAGFSWTGPVATTAGTVNIGLDLSGGAPPQQSFGVAPPPPVSEVAIYTIQGAAQVSPLVGTTVTTSGIVTAVDSNGFYLQDPVGDGNAATSDAIFVFTGGAPAVSVGDSVRVNGSVSEFTPGGASTGNLSTTQIGGSPTLTVLTNSNPLPAATVLGTSGRIPPTASIDSDGLTLFNPDVDAIDFYESVEGMRVTVNGGTVVGPTNRFGEIYLIGDNASNADPSSFNARGGVTISPGDFNPERIQIDDDSGFGLATPSVNVGDTIESVTGVVSYNFGNFEIIPTELGSVTSGGLEPEVTDIAVGGDRLTVGSYNVLNLGGDAEQSRFDALAQQVITNLKQPDVIALQEIQDNDGATNSGTSSADVTLQRIVDAIAAAGGGTYAFIDAPTVDGTNGGQPGGNIRTAYIYRTDRVDLVDAGLPPGAQDDPAFVDARKPLVATFLFNGEEVTLINNHFSSKGGSTPLFGAVQPSVNGSVDERLAQAAFVNAYVDSLLAADPDARVITLGDLNEFSFFEPLEVLAGVGGDQVLFNLHGLLPDAVEEYSFIFEGNSQALDHILVTDALFGLMPLFDIVHLNIEFAGAFSDHDPLLSSFFFGSTQVPVPGSAALLLTGLFGLGALRARARRRSPRA